MYSGRGHVQPIPANALQQLATVASCQLFLLVLCFLFFSRTTCKYGIKQQQQQSVVRKRKEATNTTNNPGVFPNRTHKRVSNTPLFSLSSLPSIIGTYPRPPCPKQRPQGGPRIQHTNFFATIHAMSRLNNPLNSSVPPVNLYGAKTKTKE